MKYASISLALSLLLISCTNRVVYKEVLVPTKCDIDMPSRPILSGDLVKDYVKAMQHSEVLENGLKFCIGVGM